MYKHTINFQIGDKFTLKNLRSISYKKYARQIKWNISMTGSECFINWALTTIVKDFNRYVKTLNTIDVDTDNICEVSKVEEDYNYLHVYLKCINPDIKDYIHKENERRVAEWESQPKGRECYDKDGIRSYTEDEIAYLEHMSEYHGWSVF